MRPVKPDRQYNADLQSASGKDSSWGTNLAHAVCAPILSVLDSVILANLGGNAAIRRNPQRTGRLFENLHEPEQLHPFAESGRCDVRRFAERSLGEGMAETLTAIACTCRRSCAKPWRAPT